MRWLILGFLLCGCSYGLPQLTIEGGNVHVVDDEKTLQHCERVGPVSENFGGYDRATNNWAALRSLFNSVGLTKATHVAQLSRHDLKDDCGDECIEIRGVAYRCEINVVRNGLGLAPLPMQ